MKQPTTFAKHMSRFLGDYLTNERGASSNTIKSYSQTFILLINYLHDVKNIDIHRLSLSHMTRDTIIDFLEWIQMERNCCDSTRNQRLSAICSFIKYTEYMDPANLYESQQILSIPVKKTEKKTISYLSIEGVKLLLQQPDAKKNKGLRNLALLSLMYESAARVQEIIEVTPSSLSLNSNPYSLRLHGKGNKHRIVPLPEKEVKILEKYMEKYDLFKRSCATKPLFPNYQGRYMTRNGINNILTKYVRKAKEQNTSLIPERLSCHSLRHSKAMHLLEANVDLIYIRDFLGHKSVITTEMYARVNPKFTFEAVKNAYKDITAKEIPLWKENPEILEMLREYTK